MTFDEYIKNPMGSSVMTNRAMYHDMYSQKWDTIKVRENGLIIRTLYQKGDDFYIHFKIPSEVVPKFYYDTVVRFYIPKNKKTGTTTSTLSGYDVQFYSNDPSFVYTFAHAFKKNDMFIKDLEYKMSDQALKEKAREKNPKDELGYVKSLYFAYLETKSSGLFSKSKWEIAAKQYSKKVWDSTVTHADDKIAARQEQGAAISKREKRENNKERNSTSSAQSQRKTTSQSPNQSNFGHFKKTDYNTIAKARNNINKSIGRFKKSFK